MASTLKQAICLYKPVAFAKDNYLTPSQTFADSKHLHAVVQPKFGQDITFGRNRKAPKGHSVGDKEADLKKKMLKLLSIFASGDGTGMAKTLFDEFFKKESHVRFFESIRLNQAADKHDNIIYFCKAALGAPPLLPPKPSRGGPHKPMPKHRIHQALKKANWDITKLVAPNDLGVPAFNNGNKAFSTGDFDNGLGLMINGLQYAYIYAMEYELDEGAGHYKIKLRYIFYDVFGLDDDDLVEFGATSDSIFSTNAGIGITAWWQLQHQFGYAPLVTRIIVDKSFVGPLR